MTTLDKLSGHRCRVRINVGEAVVLRWENFLPKGFGPLLVLDASGSRRALYTQWFRGKGQVQFLYSPQKTYKNLTIHHLDAPSGRSFFYPSETKDNRDWNWRHIAHDIQQVIAQIPDGEQGLVLHFKPAENIIDLEAVLRRQQLPFETQTDVLPSAVPEISDVGFLHWGAHTGINDFRDAKHAIVSSVLRFPKPEIEAKGRGALDLTTDDTYTDADYKDTDLGEVMSNLYQGVSRTAIRFCVDGDCPPGCHLWVIYKTGKGGGLPRGLLERTFPEANVVEWVSEAWERRQAKRLKRSAKKREEKEAQEKPLSGKIASLFEVLANAPGKTLQKKEIMKRLGYQQQQHLNRDLKDPRLQAKLKERGVLLEIERSTVRVGV